MQETETVHAALNFKREDLQYHIEFLKSNEKISMIKHFNLKCNENRDIHLCSKS